MYFNVILCFLFICRKLDYFRLHDFCLLRSKILFFSQFETCYVMRNNFGKKDVLIVLELIEKRININNLI